MAIIELKMKESNYMAKTRYGNRYFCKSDPAIEFPIFGNPYYTEKEHIMIFIDGVPKKFETNNVGGKSVIKRNYQLVCEFIKDKRINVILNEEELSFFKEYNKSVYEEYNKSKPAEVKEEVTSEVEEVIEVKEQKEEVKPSEPKKSNKLKKRK